MTDQHEVSTFDGAIIGPRPQHFRIDGNKVKTLDDVKKIINALRIIVSPDYCAHNDLKHLLTDIQEDN